MPDGQAILFASSQPGFRVDGQDRMELSRDLLELEVEESTEGMASLRFTLSAIGPTRGERDESLLWLDGRVLDFGKVIEVRMGRAGAQDRVFEGRISAIELEMEQGREPQLHVRAEDRLMDLRMTRRFRTWENATIEDIAQGIAAQHGLSASVDLDGPAQKMLQQWNQTDLAFLRDQAARLAGEIWLDERSIHVAERGRRDGPSITLIQGATLIRVAIRADLAEQRSKVTVGGFDAGDKATIAEDGEASVATSESEGRRTGPSLLESAFGTRDSFRLRDVPLSAAEARAWSRAAMLSRARRFVQAEGVTDGTPNLRPGARLKLERVGDIFAGEGYRVTRSLHRYDLVNGYRTLFWAERAGLGSPS
ncbi:phage late control D family protein [Falsiroseomonas sp. HW251]|uniref:phage late control D family protein n=1 Tax=Falsiroseomonas sp. HW251 TaxID=3390998 RepID=UPI003D318594